MKRGSEEIGLGDVRISCDSGQRNGGKDNETGHERQPFDIKRNSRASYWEWLFECPKSNTILKINILECFTYTLWSKRKWIVPTPWILHKFWIVTSLPGS